ncbi:MAG: hypothetical protein H7141_13735 [Burkholderiales bacterium]|nr:hypothetical protein [Bacteroidia bacterium]
MNKLFLYTLLIVVIKHTVLSQENNLPPSPSHPVNQNPMPPKDFRTFKERLYVGGNVGAWFGSSTFINISPLVGCKITKEFSLGVTGTYNYYSQTYGNQKFVSTVYGGGAFGRYLFFENFFAQAGLERLSVLDYRSIIPGSRVWVDNILVGGGYRQPFSQRGSFVAAIFYNINQTPLSPYPNPIIQIGFNIGL